LIDTGPTRSAWQVGALVARFIAPITTLLVAVIVAVIVGRRRFIAELAGVASSGLLAGAIAKSVVMRLLTLVERSALAVSEAVLPFARLVASTVFAFLHFEYRATTARDPDAFSVGAPCPTLDALSSAELIDQPHIASIGRASLAVFLLRFTGNLIGQRGCCPAGEDEDECCA
jgi:hypothetical protein